MTKLKTMGSRLTSLPPKTRELTAGSWRDGKTSAERGYDWKWQIARGHYLKANPLCVMCHDDGRVVPATVVDHKIAHRGNKQLFWDQSNWQALCKPHHDSHAQRRDNAEKFSAR